MVTRFEKLFALPPNLYSEGSPIIVSAGSLLKDIETEKIVVQLKFKNISSELIKALKIDISAYDVSGKSVEGINNYQYLDLAIGNGEEFGANKAIILPNTVTRSFSIKNKLLNDIKKCIEINNSRKLCNLKYIVRRIRNSIAHFHIECKADKNTLEIDKIVFSDYDNGNNTNIPDFRISFTVELVKDFVDQFSDEVAKSIVGQ